MNTGPRVERRPRASPFQFSLATALVVVTGVCVALSLVLCHLTFGLMAAIVLVGGGWSAAARRAGYRKLAYCLAASALGVIAHLVLAGVFFAFPTGFLEEVWFSPWAVLGMSVSTAAAAMCVRRLRNKPVRAALAGVYLTASIFPLFFAAFALFAAAIAWLGGQTPPPGAVEGVFFVVVGLIVAFAGGVYMATITLPVTWPMGILFCVILRRIDPLPEVRVETGRHESKVVHRDAEPSEGEPSARSP